MTNRREVAESGFTGNLSLARAALRDPNPALRETAIGALHRLGALETDDLSHLIDPARESVPQVRRRAVEIAAQYPGINLRVCLDDPDWSVVEMACWSIGEHEAADEASVDRLIDLATGHAEPLVREAAVASLGALGDLRGLPAIIAATHDKPAIRRRAAVSLAPFDTPEAEAALRVLLTDRDWQTRQIAEDLLDERPGTRP